MKPLDILKQLATEDNRKRHPDFPDDYRPAKKYKTSTANGLTKAVVDFLNFSGHWATRVNNQGTWVKDKWSKGGGYYRPSTQAKGIADIDSSDFRSCGSFDDDAFTEKITELLNPKQEA